MNAYENFAAQQRQKLLNLMNGDTSKFTYIKIEGPMVDNDLIAKYLPKFKEASKKENPDDELLDLLNNFSNEIKQSSNLLENIVKNDRDKEFDRTESLTFAETDKERDWCREHTKKYHEKADKKAFKANPFYGGVSPVSRFITVFEYCSISSWAECRCQECYKKYEQEKEKLDNITDKSKYKKQKKLVDKLYNQAQFTIRDID